MDKKGGKKGRKKNSLKSDSSKESPGQRFRQAIQKINTYRWLDNIFLFKIQFIRKKFKIVWLPCWTLIVHVLCAHKNLLLCVCMWSWCHLRGSFFHSVCHTSQHSTEKRQCIHIYQTQLWRMFCRYPKTPNLLGCLYHVQTNQPTFSLTHNQIYFNSLSNRQII